MMARPTSSRPAGSSTTTVVLENPTQQRQQQQQTLVLRLSGRPSKKVTWKEGTVDNEFLQRKSSKKCCIFHKEKSFDEDDSDEEDRHVHESKKESRLSGDGCCSKDSEAGTSSCEFGAG